MIQIQAEFWRGKEIDALDNVYFGYDGKHLARGRIKSLLFQDPGFSYGPAGDQIVAEAVVTLDNYADLAYGARITGAPAGAPQEWPTLLRSAFRDRRCVRVEAMDGPSEAAENRMIARLSTTP
jgi:hypothetical protein